MKRPTFPIALFFTALLATSAWAVPARSPSAAPPAPLPPAAYQVKKGDSLYVIGRRTGISVKELQRLNGLKGDALKPGQVLLLGPKATPATGKGAAEKPSTAPAVRPAPAAGSTVAAATYKVKKGDSLYAIARSNGLTVLELKRLNGLKSDTLKSGQKLLLAKATSAGPPPEIAASPDPAKLLREESIAKPSEKGLDSLTEVAYSYLATPYRFGGSSHQGIDCSSFVRNVFRELNIELPRTAREQYRLGAQVNLDELHSGDLLFFRTYAKYPSHVGIYLGDQKMIHASPRSRRVVITNIAAPYFRSRVIGAKRLALLGEDLNLEALTRDVEEEPETPLEEEIDPVATSANN
jgi:cell wall-associated NlpC family hydrolase